MDEVEQEMLLREWHKTAAVECLCQGVDHNPNPLLYVKQVNGSLFLANYPSNSKNNINHDFKCRYNRFGYRSLLADKGIRIGENEINISLDIDIPSKLSGNQKQPSAIQSGQQRDRKETERKLKLTALLFMMLQEYKVSEYRPGGQRNISSRLKKIAKIINLNRVPLSDILFIADKAGRWPNKDTHQLIIGWGYRSKPAVPHPTNTKFMRLPLYSLDDPTLQITELTVLKNIYYSCSNPVPGVDCGYYLLFRGPTNKKDKNIWDRQLCFIPAEVNTRIPVSSVFEEMIIQHLYNSRRHFEKPLIGNVTELFNDQNADVLVHDSNPKIILGVKGSLLGTEGTLLQEKQASYLAKGYQYIEWDGNSPLPL
ncbi:MAG: hypothetical protein ACE3L7_05085 [Candidatus Pristimantibacillus sp.]